MKIGFFYADLDQGGIQRIIVNIANYMHQKEHDVTLILRKGGGDFLSLLDEGVRIITLKESKFLFIPHLRKILKQEEYDVIFTATPVLNTYAIVARAFLPIKTKVIISEQNNTLSFFFNTKFTISKFTFLTIPFIYRFADKVVAASQGVATGLKKIVSLQDKKLTVIYNPTFTEAALNEHGTVNDPWFHLENIPTIIAVGRFVPVKNFSLLIKAVHKIVIKRPVKLIIIGDGILKESLQNEIDSLQMQDVIKLVGFQINPISWIQQAQLFVLSSNYEGFGLVIVEALAGGATIVSTDCKYGPAEILNNGQYGYLARTNDLNDLSDKIEYALDHPLDKEILIERARNYSVEAILPQYESLFLSFLKE